jgi:hypothetical protein
LFYHNQIGQQLVDQLKTPNQIENEIGQQLVAQTDNCILRFKKKLFLANAFSFLKKRKGGS